MGFSGDNGPANTAQFHNPISIQFDKEDNLFICDINNHRVRVVDAKSGTVRTFAGNGKKTLPKDGAKFAGAPLKDPRTLDFDADGNEEKFDYSRLIGDIKASGFKGIIAIEYEGSKLAPVEGVKATQKLLQQCLADV